jgi:type II secretory pathway pseudopilin PulG
MKEGSSADSFTLIELMCASTLLSVILLMMVGMQDQMSKAWKNSNRRMDATREARAALRMMSSDLGNLFFRTNTSGSTYAYNPNRSPVPLALIKNPSATILIPNAQPDSWAIFALVQRSPSVPTPNANFDEFSAVGYYIGSGLVTNVSGSVQTNYNLYRYFRTGTNLTTNLISYLQSANASTNVAGLFAPSTNDEILARNACNLQVTVYPSGTVPSNGLVFSVPEPTSNTAFYKGNRYQIELTTYPDEVVVSGLLGTNLGKWADSANVRKYGRTFESRKNLERDK